MPEFYTTDTVAEDSFLLISYSHRDKPIVEKCASFLIDEGLRVWYDKSLAAGDEWRAEVEGLLRHPNCCGVILFCSAPAFLSPNIARERTFSLQEQAKRGKDAYPLFIVSVTEDRDLSYMQLLKQCFDRVEGDSIDRYFPLDNLQTIMQLVGNDPICMMSHRPDYAAELLAAIKQKVPQTINKNVIIREEMQENFKRNELISVDLGSYEDTPLVWQFLYDKDDNAVLLCKDILRTGAAGPELLAWLNSTFLTSAFTAEQRKLLQGSIRLLNESEAKDAQQSLLCGSTEWWLADMRGSMQMIAREDGTIYRNGYNNKRFEKGIRPVILLRMDDARELVFNQNRKGE